MSAERSKVFEVTCNRYMDEIRQIDFLAKAGPLGVTTEGETLLIPLYEKLYRLNSEGIEAMDGTSLSPAMQVMICKYVLTCPQQLPKLDDTFMTYREFRDASPLVSHFTTNTNKTLEAAFSGKLSALKERAIQLKGEELESETYDLSLQFHAFPRVPVI